MKYPANKNAFLLLGWRGLRSSPTHSPEVRTNGLLEIPKRQVEERKQSVG